MRSNGGSFVFFSSAASKVGLKNHEVISGAKGAISSIALSAASTYANYNIRVNAIAPGLVETPLTKKITSSEVSFEYSRNISSLLKYGFLRIDWSFLYESTGEVVTNLFACSGVSSKIFNSGP